MRPAALGVVGWSLVVLVCGCGTRPQKRIAISPPTKNAVELAVNPADVRQIILVRQYGGPGVMQSLPLPRDEITLVQNNNIEDRARFLQLAKALLDNGFMKLESDFSVADSDGLAITLVYGDKDKTIRSYPESEQVYLFEMLIRGADANMKRRRTERDQLNSMFPRTIDNVAPR